MATITQQENTLSFSGDLLINNINDALAQLQKLRLDPPLTLDFSKVEEVDTVAVSLIFEIQRQFHHEHAQHYRRTLRSPTLSTRRSSGCPISWTP